MFHILIASHGDFCLELIRSGEIIAGKIEDVHGFPIHPGRDLEEYKAQIKEKISTLSKTGDLLVFSDIMYGTPFNSIAEVMDTYTFKHFSGVNMPIFLEAIVSRKTTSLDEVVNTLKDLKNSSIIYVNDLLEEVEG